MKSSPVVFLDRDGVLCEERSYIRREEELHIFPFVSDCIREFHAMGYLTIVITNQSGIARGYFTEKDLIRINEYLMRQTRVDAIYYCPHYEGGVIPKYSIKCKCRKPETGLIDMAERDFSIQLDNSFFVGDRASDIQTGKNAGIRTILVESGYGTKRLEEDIRADYVVDDLREVVELCKREMNNGGQKTK